MEPSWNGRCPAERCYIDSGGYGHPNPELHDQLPFDRLVKDLWRPIPYEFDPTTLSTVQFRVAVAKARGQSFSFCLDALGILR
jgi:hypothetical protein